MELKTVEEVFAVDNGDVIVDVDGVVFHADGQGKYWCPGDNVEHTADEVSLPALKVYPIKK